MSILVATIGVETGSRKHVQRLIDEQEWTKIILVGSTEAQKDFSCTKEMQWIPIDTSLFLKPLKEQIQRGLVGKIGFGDVGVSIISGSGKEHMAMLSALIQSGAGIRFVAITPEGVQEI